jgi:hypothetical protein
MLPRLDVTQATTVRPDADPTTASAPDGSGAAGFDALLLLLLEIGTPAVRSERAGAGHRRDADAGAPGDETDDASSTAAASEQKDGAPPERVAVAPPAPVASSPVPPVAPIASLLPPAAQDAPARANLPEDSSPAPSVPTAREISGEKRVVTDAAGPARTAASRRDDAPSGRHTDDRDLAASEAREPVTAASGKRVTRRRQDAVDQRPSVAGVSDAEILASHATDVAPRRPETAAAPDDERVPAPRPVDVRPAGTMPRNEIHPEAPDTSRAEVGRDPRGELARREAPAPIEWPVAPRSSAPSPDAGRVAFGSSRTQAAGAPVAATPPRREDGADAEDALDLRRRPAATDRVATDEGPERPDARAVAAPLDAGRPAPARVQDPPPTTPAAEPRAAEPAPAVDQVVRAARLVVGGGESRLEIRLDPVELGAIRLTVGLAEGTLGLTLEAERPETRLLLVEAAPRIQAMLAARGLAGAVVLVAAGTPGEAMADTFRRSAPRSARASHEPLADPRRRKSAGGRVATVDLIV